MAELDTRRHKPEDADARERIEEDGDWAACWICREVFATLTQTKSWCIECERGFCRGTHGRFVRRENGPGFCVPCWTKEHE